MGRLHFGRRSVEQILAKAGLEPLESVLRRVHANLDVLTNAFAPDEERLHEGACRRRRRTNGADRRFPTARACGVVEGAIEQVG